MKKIFLIAIAILAFSCQKNDEGSIFGTATAGDVVSGITVKLYSEGTEFLMDTTTDTEGDFSFSGLEAGNYYIGATVNVNGEVWDTGNAPQIFYIGDEIAKEIALTLKKK